MRDILSRNAYTDIGTQRQRPHLATRVHAQIGNNIPEDKQWTLHGQQAVARAAESMAMESG